MKQAGKHRFLLCPSRPRELPQRGPLPGRLPTSLSIFLIATSTVTTLKALYTERRSSGSSTLSEVVTRLIVHPTNLRSSNGETASSECAENCSLWVEQCGACSCTPFALADGLGYVLVASIKLINMLALRPPVPCGGIGRPQRAGWAAPRGGGRAVEAG